jgi:hypothetical protein
MFDIEKVKVYKDEVGGRRRTMRFLEDNATTYMDYPENKVFMVDREDLAALNYYKTGFADRCFYVGLACSTVLAVGLFARKRPNQRLMALPIAFAPMPVAAGYHYYRTGEFLEYCEIKYSNRGLNDEDLWNYHRKNSARKFS